MLVRQRVFISLVGANSLALFRVFASMPIVRTLLQLYGKYEISAKANCSEFYGNDVPWPDIFFHRFGGDFL
jgi:hypothetical protein